MHKSSGRHPSVEALRRLSPLKRLDDSQLEDLAGQLFVYTAGRNQTIIEIGSREEVTLYLLEGRIRLRAADGAEKLVDHQSPAARDPIARLRPSLYRVSSVSPVEYLLVASSLLEESFGYSETSSLLNDYAVADSLDMVQVDDEDSLVAHIYQDLNDDRLLLRSPPTVGPQIGRVISASGDLSARKMTQLVALDPVLTIKLIKAADRSRSAIDPVVRTPGQAVAQLGTRASAEFIASCVLRESFRTDSMLLNRRYRDWWEYSVRVSNIAYRLARQNERFDPEYASLAGLLHGIGEAVLLSYAADDPQLRTDVAALEKILRASTREIGRVLLTAWRLSPELVLAAAEASNWQRDLGSSEPDYTDIVIAAQLHALASVQDSPGLPDFDKVPACRKLGLKRLSTETSRRLLDAGNKAVAAAASVIAA